MKVLYILGTQRGGTTIVGRILGLVPGVVYAGEVRRLWEFGVGPDRRCGCGDLLVDCPIWSVVLLRVRAAGIDPDLVSAWQGEVAPVEGSWRTNRAIRRPRGGSSFTGYASAMAATYHGLAEAYGVDVIIDNSKLPADGAFLAHVPGVAASYVHVVRDARGVLASQMRRRSPSSRRGGPLMPRCWRQVGSCDIPDLSSSIPSACFGCVMRTLSQTQARPWLEPVASWSFRRCRSAQARICFRPSIRRAARILLSHRRWSRT